MIEVILSWFAAFCIYSMTIGPAISIQTLIKGGEVPKWAIITQPILVYMAVLGITSNPKNERI